MKDDRRLVDEQDRALGARCGLWGSLVVLLLTLGLNSWHAAPGVTFHDAGEFAMAAWCGGIPHPPGAPTWTALATGFVWAGGFIDNPARGTNLFTAWLGAITVAMTYLIAWYWLDRLKVVTSQYLRTLGALFPGLLLYQSSGFLEQCFATEQYTLMTALIALLFLLGTLASRLKGAQFKRSLFVFLIGLVWALAIGNHLSQAALGVFVIWMLWESRDVSEGMIGFVKVALISFAGFLSGLLVFLWLPLRSASQPFIDYVQVDSWARFLWAIRRDFFTKRPVAEAPEGFLAEWVASYDFVGQLSWVGVLGFVMGVVVLLKRKSGWAGWLFFSCVPYAIGLILGQMGQSRIDINFIRQYGVVDWHLPIYLAMSLAAAIGLSFGLNQLEVRRSKVGSFCSVFLLFGLLLTGWDNLRSESLRDYDVPERFVEQIMESVDEDAIVLLLSDNLSNMVTYDRYVKRSDSDQWIAYDRPSLRVAIDQRLKSDREWEMADTVNHLRKVLPTFKGEPLRLSPLSELEIRRRSIVTEYSPHVPLSGRFLRPCGILFELVETPVSNEEARLANEQALSRFPHLFELPEGDEHRWTREAWGILHQRRGGYFMDREMWPEAMAAFDLAHQWIETNSEIEYCRGYLLEALEKPSEARNAYLEAIALNPYVRGPRGNLAILLAKDGHLQEAIMLLRHETALDPENERVSKNLQLMESEWKKLNMPGSE